MAEAGTLYALHPLVAGDTYIGRWGLEQPAAYDADREVTSWERVDLTALGLDLANSAAVVSRNGTTILTLAVSVVTEDVTVDGQTVTESWLKWSATPAQTATLEQGRHTLRVKVVGLAGGTSTTDVSTVVLGHIDVTVAP